MQFTKRTFYFFVFLIAMLGGYYAAITYKVAGFGDAAAGYPPQGCNATYWNESVSSGTVFSYVYFNPFANVSQMYIQAALLCHKATVAQQNATRFQNGYNYSKAITST